jgi:hypothetical protein
MDCRSKTGKGPEGGVWWLSNHRNNIDKTQHHRASNTAARSWIPEEMSCFFTRWEIEPLILFIITSVQVLTRTHFLWKVISWLLNKARSLNGIYHLKCVCVGGGWVGETGRGHMTPDAPWLPGTWLVHRELTAFVKPRSHLDLYISS